MNIENKNTFYAPAERASEETLKKQIDFFSGETLLKQFLDAIPDIVLILNKERQIIFNNQILLDFIGVDDAKDVFGKRPGEVLDCVHAFEWEHGCGTTEFCINCGAVNAILSSVGGRKDVQECRITRRSAEALDLKVWTTPLKINNEEFTIFSVTDISHEKRRMALEKIFFHDILNTAGGLIGFSELLSDAKPSELKQYSEILYKLSRDLVDEIIAQKDLSAAENNELVPEAVNLRSVDILEEIAVLYRHHRAADNKHIDINKSSKNIEFISDPKLINRVLGNMVKNALEASDFGSTITLGCTVQKDRIEFWVHNPVFIPRDIQLQIFQRSFTTKGMGRGLGTYSVKLLTESYLHGKVSFTSTVEGGTTFRASYPIIGANKV
ncbi:MAG: HAMP domain-containing histidine kinase [Spirochaetota bacterium]|nr:HAMP domain-containing histidine kinase [Spirochaetota bacterium]